MTSTETRPVNPTRLDFPSLSRGKNNDVIVSKASFPRYLELDFGQVDRRDLNPYKLKQEIESKINGKLAQFTGSSKNKITIQTRNANQTEKCLEISTLSNRKCDYY